MYRVCTVLKGDIQKRCRQLIIQIWKVEEVVILKGVVSKDHVHMHIEDPPKVAISQLMKRIKGRTSRMLQKEFPRLKRRYWGRHFWASGYGVWSTGNITDDMVQQYLEHHRDKDGGDNSDFIME
jgi:putative transposase